MSVSKIGIILFSSFLIFATAPLASAQKNTANKETGKNQQDQQQTYGDNTNQTSQTPGTASEPAATSVDEVKHVQQSLADLGYNPGDINGVMTADTQQAIRQFQWFNSLPVTGIVDQQTMA